MGLLNYTTEIDADKTAMEIAKCLSMHGASAVLTEYDEVEGTVTALSFKINLEGKAISFRLPCDWRPVFEVMYKGKKAYPSYHKFYNKQQSEWRSQAVRTSWRIVKDWVEAQMALVETRMATTQQVFLPYAVMKSGKTLSEHIIEDPAFLLGDGN